jgi:hypothetical protein
MINPQMVGSSLSVEDMKRFFVHVVVERGLPYCQKLSFPKRCPVKTKNGVTAQAAKDSCQLFTKASAIRAMGTMPFAIGCTKRLDVSYFHILSASCHYYKRNLEIHAGTGHHWVQQSFISGSAISNWN